MTTTTTSQRHFPLGRAGVFVEERIRPLQSGYLADRSDAVAILAQLRRGAGKPIEDVPELWGLTCNADLYSGAQPRGGDRWPAEDAAHTSLTLYAAHQQSRRDAAMHVVGRDLGGAVRRLMPGNDIDEPLRKRFVQVGSATSMDSLAYRLREIIVLLRRDAIPLDYGLLADQLYTFQLPGRTKEVRLAWGRGFHAYRAKSAETDEPASDTTTDKDAS